MMYRLKYLPLALDDLRDITDYITETLKAPKAAIDLLDTLKNPYLGLSTFPRPTTGFIRYLLQ